MAIQKRNPNTVAGLHLWHIDIGSGDVLLITTEKRMVGAAARKANAILRDKTGDYYRRIIRSVSWGGTIDA